jgi:hypothetical protein
MIKIFEQMAVFATGYVAMLFLFMLLFILFSGFFWVKNGVYRK